MARMVCISSEHMVHNLMENRTAEQAEGGKVVGVDPAVITAGRPGWSSEIYMKSMR